MKIGVYYGGDNDYDTRGVSLVYIYADGTMKYNSSINNGGWRHFRLFFIEIRYN